MEWVKTGIYANRRSHAGLRWKNGAIQPEGVSGLLYKNGKGGRPYRIHFLHRPAAFLQ